MVRVLKPVRVQRNGSLAEFLPAEYGLTLDVAIDFAASVIGRQRKILTIDFARFAANWRGPAAQASCAISDPCKRRAWRSAPRWATRSLCLRTRCSYPQGLRFPDEFVRHKMLDALGDLALAGAPIVGVSAPIAVVMR